MKKFDGGKDNPIRSLRNTLRMSQGEFANALGFTLASVNNWERGLSPSEDSIGKLQTFAIERGLPDVGDAIRAAAFGPRKATGVVKVYGPESKGNTVPPPKAGMKDLRFSLHETVDSILNEGDAEAIAMMEATLTFISSHVRGK